MILLKGESYEVFKYHSREEIIYEYYVEHIKDIISELKMISNQLKELQNSGIAKDDESIKDLKRLRQRLKYRINKEYDFLFKHMSRLDKEDEERIWKDLKGKNIL